MYDVMTIGAAVKDVFLMSDQFQLLPSDTFEGGMGECVALGSKIEIQNIVQTTGGGATNAAVTFARLGMRASAVCKIGKDSAGQDVLRDLRENKVSVSLVTTDKKQATGYSTLLTTATGERTILVYRGASGSFASKEIPLTKLSAAWIYMTSLGGNVALASQVIKHAKQKQSCVAWNPGGKELNAGLQKLAPLLGNVRVLSLNREEAARLTGTDDVCAAFAALASRGNIVLITDGPNGAYVHTDGATLFSPGTGKRAISQTGAGDAFGSGFVAGYIKYHDVRAALAVALLNAESVIGQVGAKAGILRSWPNASAIKKIRISTL